MPLSFPIYSVCCICPCSILTPNFFFLFAALINLTCLHMKHMTNWKECCSWLSTNVLRDLVLLNSKRHPEIVLHTKRFSNTSVSAGCRTNTFYKCRITKSAINGDIDAVLWMKLLYYVLLWKEGACQALYRYIYPFCVLEIFIHSCSWLISQIKM